MGETAKHFKDWLESYTAFYFQWLSRNVYGDDTFSASSSLTCYLDETIRHITNFKNQEVVSDAQLYIDGDNPLAAGISPKDKFIVSGANRFPQNIRSFRDERGNLDYMVVYL